MHLVRMDTGQMVCRAQMPRRLGEKMRGLLGSESLAEEEGMLFDRASSIHTFGMRYPIDVVWCRRDGRVLRVDAAVPPSRLKWCPRAHMCLELPAGRAERCGLAAGQRLEWESVAATG